VAPSRVPLTFSLPICLASAPFDSRKTVTVASLPEASVSVTVMLPFPLSQEATAEKSRMLQASALPATPSASAAEAEATPRIRTVRAVRRDMDTIALHRLRNCGGCRGICCASFTGNSTPTSFTGL